MARIYRKTDRIPVKIGDIVVQLAPLTIHQKTEVQQTLLQSRINGDIREATRGITLAIQYSLKGISGLVDSDGNPYALKFSNDILEEECVSDLLNMEFHDKLTLVCIGLVKGVPTEFTDENGKPIEGVEVVKPAENKPEKNG
jgi:hypothetical protein